MPVYPHLEMSWIFSLNSPKCSAKRLSDRVRIQIPPSRMSTYGINAYRTLIVPHIVRAGFRILRPVLEHSLKPYRRGSSFIGETLRL
jgi:hypothetical protein